MRRCTGTAYTSSESSAAVNQPQRRGCMKIAVAGRYRLAFTRWMASARVSRKGTAWTGPPGTLPRNGACPANPDMAPPDDRDSETPADAVGDSGPPVCARTADATPITRPNSTQTRRFIAGPRSPYLAGFRPAGIFRRGALSAEPFGALPQSCNGRCGLVKRQDDKDGRCGVSTRVLYMTTDTRLPWTRP